MMNPRRWQAEQVIRFAALMGVEDPIEAVKRRANELIQRIEGPPYRLDCDKICTAVNIKKIQYKEGIPGDGRILWKDDGYIIEINSRSDKARRAFTVAHEIAHTFFSSLEERGRPTLLDKATGQFVRDDEEEYLCDIAAAEMLMPTQAFLKRVCLYGPSARSILALTKDFETSLRSTVRRFAEVNAWKCHLGFWKVVENNNPIFEFGLGSGRLPLTIPRGFAAPLKSVITATVIHRRPIRGWSDIGLVSPLGEPFGDVFAEALYLPGPNIVISVSILDKYPQDLCRMIEDTPHGSHRTALYQGSFRFFRNR
jgi:Zn-dependent peptidase ImmA (M78 family)